MRKTTLKISKILPVVILFMLTAFTALAQNVITGRVTESRNGNAVSNVTVTVKGTRISTQTGADGSFKISAPTANPTLVFSSIGYATQESTASGNTVSISLVQSDQKLDEIVVVAYGTRKKTDLTGAVTQVSAKDFQKGNIASSEQLLQGKVAGLEITTGGGAAGGGSKIRIRQGASLNASNDPLIVIDGVPVESNGIAGSANYLNTINPDDIESISVLKDASATALYGSRASNGVLIVTTKKGGRGKARFNFNTQYTLGKVTDYIDVLSADQVRDIVNADAASTGINTYKNLLGNANTDWQEQIFQNALSANNNISAAGSFGTKSINIPYRISLGYLYQEGTLKTNKFDRMSAAVNLSPKFFNDNLSVNVNFKFSKTKNRFADEGAVGSAVSFDPTQYVRNNNPKTGSYFEWMQSDGTPLQLATRNPLALLNLRSNTSRVNRIVGNVQLDYKLPFFPDLHIQANLGLDNASGIGNDNIDSTSATNFLTKGRFTHYEQKKKNYLADVSLFYSKDLERINSKVDVLVTHSYQDFFTEVENYASYGQDGKIIPTSIPTFTTDKPQYRLESYLGRINLTLFDKYLLTGSIRRDASSKFAKDNRVGYFPAAAIAWKLKEEIFKNSNLVSELKLRFGWGITGQQDGIGNYTYLPVYAQSSPTAQYLFGNTYYQFLRPASYDKDIKWESTTTTNLGLDFGFLKNRISGTVELYKKKTEDLLSVIPIAPGSNFSIDLLTNVGNIENKGVELTINTTPVRRTNFSWDFGFNVTYNESKITNLLRQQDPNFQGIDVSGISGGTGNNIGKFAVGYAPYVFNVFKQVYDNAGNPIEGLYEDINRDGKIDDADRYLYKKPAPDFMYGLNTVFTYKKFSVGLAGHGMVDNYLYNNFNSNNGVLRNIKNPINFVGNASANYLETGFENNRYLSDYYIENASFFRLDNINLGYNFGNILRNKTTLRVSASVQNVFVITKYSGADPENSNQTGVDNNIYPRPRIYSIGANIDF